VHRGERTIYESPWVHLVLADVLLPDGGQVDHHVVRMPKQASGTILVRDGGILLLYRHRFITDTWGWEIPAGAVDDGETNAEAAIREAEEESGWRPSTVALLCSFNPANGILDQRFHIYVSRDAIDVGGPTDTNEAVRIDWFRPDEVRRMLLAGEILDGLTFAGLSYAFVAGAIG
jgi:8-oxo-dGDP phosphatase